MYSFEILIKSFIRFDGLRKLVESIDRFYPGVVVRIADDSPSLDDCKGFPQSHLKRVLTEKEITLKQLEKRDNTHIYIMPFDSGLSAGRNLLVDKCQSRYFVLMEDDFRVIKQTDLSKLEKVIKSSDNIVIAAGGVVSRHGVCRRTVGEVREENGELIKYIYGKYAPYITVGSVQCIKCRYSFNFFMGNRDLFKEYNIRWEEKIKVTREHAYFFHHLPKELEMYYVANVRVGHFHNTPHCYRRYRFRFLSSNLPGQLRRNANKDQRLYTTRSK